MARYDTIGMSIGSHGSFETSAASLDVLMTRYLPGLEKWIAEIGIVADLRSQIQARLPELDYSDLATVTECLMVLAELDGCATN